MNRTEPLQGSGFYMEIRRQQEHSPCALNIPDLQSFPTLPSDPRYPAGTRNTAVRAGEEVFIQKPKPQRGQTHPATLVPFTARQSFGSLQTVLALQDKAQLTCVHS